MQLKQDLLLITKLSIEAGQFIMEEYARPETEIQNKADDSPLTAADLRAHNHISKGLEGTGIPVISEESYSADNENKTPDIFWLIDPLDGTKEFIKRRKEFTVNIALVKDLKPVSGCVYVPATGIIYLGSEEGIAWMFHIDAKHPCNEDAILQAWNEGKEIRTNWNPEKLRVVASKSHLDQKTRDFIKRATSSFRNSESAQFGSSLKICAIAEGRADLYPRFGPTSRWDTAAAQAILQAAGGGIIALEDRKPLSCNLTPILNPPFLAFASSALLTRLDEEEVIAQRT